MRSKTRKRVEQCSLAVLGKIAIEKDFTIHGGAAHGIIRCFFLGTPSTSVVLCRPLKQCGNLLNRLASTEALFP